MAVRLWGAATLAALLALVPALRAEPADLSARLQLNSKQFTEFKLALLRLAQKYQRSDKPEDQDRAKVILAALDLAAKENVEGQFKTLVAEIDRGAKTLPDVQRAEGQDKQLTKALQDIFAVLMTDDETARLKVEIARIGTLLKDLKSIERAELQARALTEANKVKADRLAKQQAEITERTKELAKRMGGENKDGKPGGNPAEKEPTKTDPKADAKPGDQAGKDKPDPAEPKAGEPKAGEPKAGDPKAGDPKAGDPKAGDPKAGDPKAGDPKAGEPKGGDPKAGGEPKAGDPKPGDPKKEDPKSAGGKEKPEPPSKADSKSAKGEPGGDGKGKNSPPSGESQAGAPKPGSPKPPSGGSPPPGGSAQKPPAPQTPGRKELEEALPHQQAAEDDLTKDKRPQAAKGQDEALKAIEKAKKELEKRLKQLREEEALKRLANLEARCSRMLALQKEVYEATKVLDGTILKNNGQKTTVEVQKSQQQGDKEGEIVAEADRALKLMAGEGSAVAFATVLEEVRVDMQSVQRRLGAAAIDSTTLEIEQNVIAMLGEMVKALKQAQQDAQQQQQQSQGGPPPPDGPQKLIDLINELKLIRTLQQQVNTRTRAEGRKTPAEQAKDPLLQAEIQQLSGRQVKLQDMIQKIATGANE